ncbi:MAG: transposase [Wenzhouxiangella sp.]|nr:transposase [Wenzhouxiangella sp.]
MDQGSPACKNVGMTYPRSHLVSEDEPGFYHVVSRCVRRALLCGKDKLTGQCFEHRRQWIEARILELADCFSVSVFSYAVMSNLFHVVLHVDPATAHDLSDEEVARRWLTAFPGPLTNEIVNRQTLSASEPASGKARERRHSKPISSERNAAGGRL